MLRIINVILFILVSYGVFSFSKDSQNVEKQEVVEIYPGEEGDEYDELVEIFGSEKASTE